MLDLRKHIVGLLDGSPKTQERVAAALHMEPHPTGAAKEVWHFIARNHEFSWHPRSQKVYIMHHTGNQAPDGSLVREARLIATDVVTHGDAINAANIFMRGMDYQARVPRPHFIEAREKYHG